MNNKPIITYPKIMELNQLFEEKQLRAKVHLKDACGSQTMWIEELDSEEFDKNQEGLNEKEKEIITQTVKEYFERQAIKVKFGKDGQSFWCE